MGWLKELGTIGTTVKDMKGFIDETKKISDANTKELGTIGTTVTNIDDFIDDTFGLRTCHGHHRGIPDCNARSRMAY